jgi:hypothetical protein
MDNYRNFTGGCGIRKNYYDLEDPDLGSYAKLLSPDVPKNQSAFLFKVKQPKGYYSWTAQV